MSEMFISQIKILNRYFILIILFSIVANIAIANPKSAHKKKSPAGMVLIPGGEYMMGSPITEGLNDEHPRHRVSVDAFYIDKYLVTFRQYDKFCEATNRKKPEDQGWGRGSRPVINVSWDDANAYSQWVNKRLPTEAEYEKAARARTETKYFFGNDDYQLGNYAWFIDNSGGMTHPVGEKRPNPYGLYDILGNVWEWCSDWHDAYYYANSPLRNPQGSTTYKKNGHAMRGGSWNDDKYSLRAACRSFGDDEHLDNYNGFRCAKTP